MCSSAIRSLPVLLCCVNMNFRNELHLLRFYQKPPQCICISTLEVGDAVLQCPRQVYTFPLLIMAFATPGTEASRVCDLLHGAVLGLHPLLLGRLLPTLLHRGHSAHPPHLPVSLLAHLLSTGLSALASHLLIPLHAKMFSACFTACFASFMTPCKETTS